MCVLKRGKIQSRRREELFTVILLQIITLHMSPWPSASLHVCMCVYTQITYVEQLLLFNFPSLVSACHTYYNHYTLIFILPLNLCMLTCSTHPHYIIWWLRLTTSNNSRARFSLRCWYVFGRWPDSSGC